MLPTNTENIYAHINTDWNVKNRLILLKERAARSISKQFIILIAKKKLFRIYHGMMKAITEPSG